MQSRVGPGEGGQSGLGAADRAAARSGLDGSGSRPARLGAPSRPTPPARGSADRRSAPGPKGRQPTVRGPRTRHHGERRTGVYARLAGCPVRHDHGVDWQHDRRNWGRRLGVNLGLIRPLHGPRSQLARVIAVGADSSHGELVTATVISFLEFLLVASNVLSHSLWRQLISVVALILLVNLVRAVRLLGQQHRSGRGHPPAT